MRREAMDAERRRARDTRVVLAGLLALSVLSNLVLAHGLANRERVTVLVPAVSGPAWEVGESWAGRRYLEDAARTAAVTLLTLTPENAAHVREAAARLAHAEARGAIGAWVAAEAERMARRDLSTAFYPRSIESDTRAGDTRAGDGRTLSAEIAGELVTWIGREEAFREKRRYRLAFRIDGGRLALLRFEQMED